MARCRETSTKPLVALLAALCLIASACTDGDTPAETTAPQVEQTSTTTTEEELQEPSTESTDNSLASSARLEVALVFNYHQPYLPEKDGAIELSSARLSAARNYLDLAQLLEEFPAASASLAISAPTIQQLEALTNPRGVQRTVDRHHLVTSTPVQELAPDDLQFILNHFFEGPASAFETLPRWDELRELRDAGSTLTDPDLRDATVLFHLAQVDAEFIEDSEKLSELVAQGRAFSDADARAVLQAIDNRVDLISVAYSELLDSDRFEIITSTGALPSADPVRLKDRTTNTLGTAADFFGEAPNGMTLVGDVATDADLSAIAAGGVQWILIPDSGSETESAAPKQLTVSGGSLELISADPTLADLIANDYFDLNAADAVRDFTDRLQALADAQSASEPGLVTVVIEGSDTWDRYENDGSTFLRTLLNALTTNEDFGLTTPSRYLAERPDALEAISSAEQFLRSDTSNWVGEPQESLSETLIGEARLALDEAASDQATSEDLTEADLAAAEELIRNAEAADFGFYFGQDQDSGQDQVYDRAFRTWLTMAYETLGLESPESLLVPIVPPPTIAAASTATDEVAITIDGNPSDWAGATLFDFADSNDVIAEFGIAIDGEALALRFDGGIESEVQIYLAIPRNDADRTTSISGDSLGFGATHMVLWSDTEGGCLSELLPPDNEIGILPTGCVQIESGLSEAGVELKILAETLGGLEAGDVIAVRIKTGSSLGPIAGPILAEIPVSSP